MVGEYPLFIEGKNVGKLSVRQKGLKYSFEAFFRASNSVVRLSVFGGDRAGYLGVMQPYKNGLRLYREFTKSELLAFPQRIEYAADARVEARTEKKSATADDIIWKKNPVGLLSAEYGGEKLCAIPKSFGIAAYGRELPTRDIEGVLHRIFVIKTGKN